MQLRDVGLTFVFFCHAYTQLAPVSRDRHNVATAYSPSHAEAASCMLQVHIYVYTAPAPHSLATITSIPEARRSIIELSVLRQAGRRRRWETAHLSQTALISTIIRRRTRAATAAARVYGCHGNTAADAIGLSVEPAYCRRRLFSRRRHLSASAGVRAKCAQRARRRIFHFAVVTSSYTSVYVFF